MKRDLRYRQEYTTLALAEQNGRCLYCKEPLPRERATADHKRPQAHGGRTTRENIAAACIFCNQVKGATPEGKFWRLIDDHFKKPMKGANADTLLIWASRRIWRRAHRACARIEKASGLSPDFSKADTSEVVR